MSQTNSTKGNSSQRQPTPIAYATDIEMSIRHTDWQRIRRKISRIPRALSWHEIISAAAFGIFASSALSLVPLYQATQNTESWVMPTYWATGIAAAVIGTLALIYAVFRKKVISSSTEELLEDMNDIYETFFPEVQTQPASSPIHVAPTHLTQVSSIANIAPVESSPDTQPKHHLQIISANYGTASMHIDVASVLRESIINNTLTIRASNKNFGDPAPSTKKILSVDYSYEGRKQSVAVSEDDWLFIPPTETVTSCSGDGCDYWVLPDGQRQPADTVPAADVHPNWCQHLASAPWIAHHWPITEAESCGTTVTIEREIVLPDKIVHGTLRAIFFAKVDDYLTIEVNDRQVGDQIVGYAELHQRDIGPYLHEGCNVLRLTHTNAQRCPPVDPKKNPMAVSYRIELNYQSGS